MTKNVYVLRTAPYNYQVTGCNLYQSFNQVAKKHVDPPIFDLVDSSLIKKVLKEISKPEIVFCSPRKRSLQTAELFFPHPITLDELSEVNYTMENFIEMDAFFSASGIHQVQEARVAFVQALVNDQLDEKYLQVLDRIDSFLKIISKQRSENMVIFSHGFIMKITEAYIRNPKIRDTPSKLLHYFNGQSETFHFLEGFSFKIIQNNFLIP